jgi:hypothetical protein
MYLFVSIPIPCANFPGPLEIQLESDASAEEPLANLPAGLLVT